jgi:hypothetical protein
MPEEFGPNPERVRRFLTVVTTLSEKAWASSAKQELAGRAAYGWTEFSELELASYRELGENRATRLLATIGKRLKSIPDGQQRHRASLAALALAFAGQLTLSHFAANYAAFNEAIPVSVLGPGSAPILEKTPTMSWFRFVIRLVALEGPGWAKAADAALMIQDAVGADVTDSALEAANCSSVSPEVHPSVLAAIGDIGREYETSMGNLYSRVGGWPIQMRLHPGTFRGYQTKWTYSGPPRPARPSG